MQLEEAKQKITAMQNGQTSEESRPKRQSSASTNVSSTTADKTFNETAMKLKAKTNESGVQISISEEKFRELEQEIQRLNRENEELKEKLNMIEECRNRDNSFDASFASMDKRDQSTTTQRMRDSLTEFTSRKSKDRSSLTPGKTRGDYSDQQQQILPHIKLASNQASIQFRTPKKSILKPG